MVASTLLPSYERGASTTTAIYLQIEGGAIDNGSLPTPTPLPGEPLRLQRHRRGRHLVGDAGEPKRTVEIRERMLAAGLPI